MTKERTQDRCEERKKAVNDLKENCTEENLWKCVIAYQEYPFHTSSGLPFTYTLKTGRRGGVTKELFIDRRENSKSLSWSSVRLAFERAMEKKGAVFARPKEIADVRGVSYSYSLLWRFGVIRVPAQVEDKLRGEEENEGEWDGGSNDPQGAAGGCRGASCGLRALCDQDGDHL